MPQKRPLLVGLSCGLIAMVATAPLFGAAFTAGNILVVHDDTLFEYTTAGVQVQSVAIEGNMTEEGRGLDYDLNGTAHIYNGTFSPVLSTYEPSGDTWQHNTFTGWSTANNLSYGGVAVFADFVFVTDMATSGAGSPEGIVNFDTSSSFSGARFATSEAYTDVTIGLDGVLYALRDDDRTIDKFTPSTMASLGTVTLGAFGLDIRGIAVNAAGAIFAASWDDNIYHFDASGVEQNSIDSGTTDLTDIDVNASGQIVVGSRFDDVVVTTEALTSVSSFSIASSFDTTFVAWVENPLPVELMTFSIE